MSSNIQTALERKKDRRGLLALLGAGGAAGAAALLGGDKRARAATGDPLIVGQENEAGDGDTTRLSAAVDDEPVLDVTNTGAEGIGVRGQSESGAGVNGSSQTGNGVFGGTDSGIGVQGHSDSGTGVEGGSETGWGVDGHSQSGAGGAFGSQTGAGVEAWSQSGNGVMGISDSGIGVIGIGQSRSGVVGNSKSDFGVSGHSESSWGVFGANNLPGGSGGGVWGLAPGNKPAVLAFSKVGINAPPDGGVALQVIGKSLFSTCGAATLPRGENSVLVPNAAVTGLSHITVTLTSNPGLREVRWVERAPGSGFRVHMSHAVLRPATGLTYLIVEPAPA